MRYHYFYYYGDNFFSSVKHSFASSSSFFPQTNSTFVIKLRDSATKSISLLVALTLVNDNPKRDLRQIYSITWSTTKTTTILSSVFRSFCLQLTLQIYLLRLKLNVLWV